LKLTEPSLLTSEEESSTRYKIAVPNCPPIELERNGSGINIIVNGTTTKSARITFEELATKFATYLSDKPDIVASQRKILEAQREAQRKSDETTSKLLSIQSKFLDIQHQLIKLKLTTDPQRTATFLTDLSTCFSSNNLLQRITKIFPRPAESKFYENKSEIPGADITDEPDQKSKVSKIDEGSKFDDDIRLFVVQLYNKLQAQDPAELKKLEGNKVIVTVTIDNLPPIEVTQKSTADYENVVIKIRNQTKVLERMTLDELCRPIHTEMDDNYNLRTAVVLDEVVTLFSTPSGQQSGFNTSAPLRPRNVASTPSEELHNSLQKESLKLLNKGQEQYHLNLPNSFGLPSLVVTPLPGNKIQLSIWENKRVLENTTISDLHERLNPVANTNVNRTQTHQ
jgi:hypothetical protein